MRAFIFRHYRCGQALVEMSLVLLLILVLSFGAVNAIQYIGAAYSIAQASRNAAHVAALQGSIGGIPDGQWVRLDQTSGPVAQSVRDTLSGSVFVDPSYVQIKATCNAGSCRRYAPISIDVRYEAQAWAPVPGVASNLRLSAQSVRTSENDAQD